MSLYIQYHNCDKRGLPHIVPGEGRHGIDTGRKQVETAQGTVFLIAGVGRPRCFYLWEAFTIDKVESFPEDGTISYRAEGPGWQLCPPQRLEGADFEAFKTSCASFVCFRKIDDLPYSVTLKDLADQYRMAQSDAMQPFLQAQLGLLKQGTEDYETVLKQMQTQPFASETGQPPAPRPKPITQRSPSVQQDSTFTKNLRALSIRQPHAEAIMRGIKKIEFRSVRTNIRGRVQIYAGLKRYSVAEEAEMLEEYGIEDVSCDDLLRGVLIGTVEVHDCTGKARKYNWHFTGVRLTSREFV
jgi:hypothetical protein